VQIGVDIVCARFFLPGAGASLRAKWQQLLGGGGMSTREVTGENVLSLWARSFPGDREIRIRAVWPDIERIVERLQNYPEGGSLLKNHPIYGQQEDFGYAFLKDVAGDLFVDRVLPRWKPSGRYSFRKWFDHFGYAILREEVCREVERTDVNLHGLWNPRTRRFAVDEAVAFTIDPFSADVDSRKGFLPSSHRETPTNRRFRLTRYVSWLADEVSDRKWRELLTDEEATSIADYIDSSGNISLTALNHHVTADGMRKRITRVCGKAWRAIRAAIDDRLGLAGIPNWDEASRYLKSLEIETSSAPYYARSSRRFKPSEIDASWEDYTPPASRREVSEYCKPIVFDAGRIKWGTEAAARDVRLNHRREAGGSDA